MTRLITAAALALLLAACGQDKPAQNTAQNTAETTPPAADAAEDPSAALTAFLDAEFKRIVLDRSPEIQTFLGIKDDYGQWSDPSKANSRETLALYRASVETMRERFDPAELNTQAKLSFQCVDGQAAFTMSLMAIPVPPMPDRVDENDRLRVPS